MKSKKLCKNLLYIRTKLFVRSFVKMSSIGGWYMVVVFSFKICENK